MRLRYWISICAFLLVSSCGSDEQEQFTAMCNIDILYSTDKIEIKISGLDGGGSYTLLRDYHPTCSTSGSGCSGSERRWDFSGSTFTAQDSPTAIPYTSNVYYSIHSNASSCQSVWYSNNFPDPAILYNAYQLDGYLVVMNGFTGFESSGVFGVGNDIAISNNGGTDWASLASTGVNFKLHSSPIAASSFRTFDATPNQNYGAYLTGGMGKNGLTGDTWKVDNTTLSNGASWLKLTTNGTSFSPRYGHSSAFFNDIIYIAGGITSTTPYTYSDEVWSSTGVVSFSDSISWTNTNTTGHFSPRAYSQLISVNDSTTTPNGLYLIGGFNASTIYSDVWYSANGTSWQKIADNAFPPRAYFQAAYLDGKFYMMGGVNLSSTTDIQPEQVYSDLWASSDAIIWQKIADTTKIGKIFGHSMLAMTTSSDNSKKLVVIGGVNENLVPQATVYSSDPSAPDSWTKVYEKATSQPFFGRFNHKVAKLNSHYYLIGGARKYKVLDTIQTSKPFLLNDIWKSPDMMIWTKVNDNAVFSPREGHLLFEYASKLYLIGGRGGDDLFLNDIWESSDGASWSLISENIPLSSCTPSLPSTSCAKFGARQGLSSITISDTQATASIPAGVYVLDRSYYWYSTDMRTWTPKSISCNLTPMYAHLTYQSNKLSYFGGFNSNTTTINTKGCETSNLTSYKMLHLPTSNTYALASFLSKPNSAENYLIAGLDASLVSSTGAYTPLNAISKADFTIADSVSFTTTATHIVFESRYGQANALDSSNRLLMTGGTTNLCYLDKRKCLKLAGPGASSFVTKASPEDVELPTQQTIYTDQFFLGLAITNGDFLDTTSRLTAIIKPIPVQ